MRLRILLPVLLGVAVGGGYLGAQAYVDGEARAQLDRLIARLPAGVRVTYRDAGYGLFSRAAVISDVTVESGAYGQAKIDKIVFRKIDLSRRVPSFGDIVVRGYKIPLDKMPPDVRKTLASFGVSELSGDFEAAWRHFPKRKRLEISALRYAFAGLGDLRLRAEFDNVPSLDPFANLIMAAITVMQAKITGGELIYRDHGLVRHWLRQQAEQEHIKPARFRENLAYKLKKELADGSDARSKANAEALGRFIAEPGEVRFRVRPPRPASVGELIQASRAQLVRRLGLTITAGP